MKLFTSKRDVIDGGVSGRRAARRRPQIVVVGAGFGGLAAARGLSDVAVDITVVDQRNHHTFQPLLYQVATAGLDVDDVCYTTRGIFGRQRNARAIRERVVAVDFEARELRTATDLVIPYDYLVLAVGAVTAYFGVPGVAEHAFGLKDAAEAVAIRTHVLTSFERAERADDPAVRDAATTVVVAGGGPTGVEMAGGFAELIDHVLRRDFPSVDADRAQVFLIEGQDRLLGAFAPKLADKARRRLERMGVSVLLDRQVAAVRAGSVELDDGTHIATDTMVWAAGVRAHPLGEALGLRVGRGGRIIVDDCLRVPGDEAVFVIGDAAAAVDADDVLLPQVAPVAIQGGQHVARSIRAAIAGELPRAFCYRDKGSMATIGRNAAVVELPSGRTFSGLVGWLAWLVLHLVMMVGFRNRANVLVNWAWNYLTYDRGSRVIVEFDESPTAASGDMSRGGIAD